MAGVNYGALSLEQTPPLSVPLRYFLTAPPFAMAAGLGLLFWGGEAMTGRWSPVTLGLTHLLTLGFLALVMVGAVQQLLPVLVGSPVPRPRLTSALVHGLLSGGTVLLTAGLVGGAPPLMSGAALLLGSGFLLFIAVSAYCLLRARSGHFTVVAMALAILALLATVALGLHLAMGYGGVVPLARQLTDLHLAWGLLGWVALLVAGVAYQVVPMFQITPAYPRLLMRSLAPVLFTLLVVGSGTAVSHAIPGEWVWGAAAVGYGIFAITTLELQRRRKRRLPDVTLDFWRLAMASLLLAVTVWVLHYGFGRTDPLLFGVLFIVGFAMSAVNGMLYKIVPFLVWLHLNNRRQMAGRSQVGIPNMRQVIPEPAMRRQFRLQLAALILLAGAALEPLLTRSAGLLLLVSMFALQGNLLRAVGLYRTVLRG